MVFNIWDGTWCNIAASTLTAGQEQTLTCPLANSDVFAQSLNSVIIGLQAISEKGAAPELAGTLLLKEVSISLPQSSSASSANSSIAVDSNSNETLGTVVTQKGYSFAPLNNCGDVNGTPDNTLTVFADYNHNAQNQNPAAQGISSWNHTTNGEAPWSRLSNSGSHYALQSAANASCNDVDTLNMVLVKKIADWDRQHANGFDRELKNSATTFANATHLVLDLQVNTAGTKIPTAAALKTAYGALLGSTSVIDALDAGKVNIGITLQGKSEGGRVWNAAIIIEVDQATYGDQWLRFSIPMNAFQYYSTLEYNNTPSNQGAFADMLIEKITLVGETANGAVLRGNISSWNVNTPPVEHFKEMDISFKKIAFELK